MDEPIDEDRRRRDEAVRAIGRAVAIWSVPILAVSIVALALGVPWWLVAAAVAFFVYILLFEA